MKLHTINEAKEMTKADALIEIEKAVYESTTLFETLQLAGKVHGSGDLMRQRVYNFAKKVMKEQWNKND